MNPKCKHIFKLNEYSHKILDKLFFAVSPIVRHSEPSENIESELFSTRNFPEFVVKDLGNKLNISDELMQNVCEYLRLHKHIDITQRFNESVIVNIRANELGYKAYKFESYLEKNETLIYQYKFKKSAFWNNVLTPLAAGLAVIVSIVTLTIQSQQSTELKIKSQEFQQQMKSLDSSRKIQTDALQLLLRDAQKKDTLKIDTTSKTK